MDFFGVTNEPRNKIKTLNLMLSLNNGIRDATDQYSGQFKQIMFIIQMNNLNLI